MLQRALQSLLFKKLQYPCFTLCCPAPVLLAIILSSGISVDNTDDLQNNCSQYLVIHQESSVAVSSGSRIMHQSEFMMISSSELISIQSFEATDKNCDPKEWQDFHAVIITDFLSRWSCKFYAISKKLILKLMSSSSLGIWLLYQLNDPHCFLKFSHVWQQNSLGLLRPPQGSNKNRLFRVSILNYPSTNEPCLWIKSKEAKSQSVLCHVPIMLEWCLTAARLKRRQNWQMLMISSAVFPWAIRPWLVYEVCLIW